MEIYRQFQFEAAHHLPTAPEGHKCRRLHGHSYRLTVTVRGPVDPREGWVMDFGRLKEAVASVYDALDHRYLNEIPGLEVPTCEVLARWIWQRLKPALPGLCRIEISETCQSGCRYEGGD